MQTSLNIDLFYAAALLLGGLLAALTGRYYLQNRLSTPSLSFSLLDSLRDASHKSSRLEWIKLPRILYFCSLVFFALALIDPHFQGSMYSSPENRVLPNKGIGIYLVIDQSGSMRQKVGRQSLTKLETVKAITKEFVHSRQNDLIGLVSFARTAQVLAPLTWDRQAIEKQIAGLEVVKNSSDDGTALGYAIYKTAHLISSIKRYAKKETGYDLQGAIMIVMTDGFQDPNPLDAGNRWRTMDLQTATNFAKAEGVRMYIVNVDPQIATSAMAPQRRLLKRYTEETGGKFYYVTEGQDLGEIYKEIDRLEKGDWTVSKEPLYFYRRFSFYPFFIALGLLCLLGGWISETMWLKRAP